MAAKLIPPISAFEKVLRAFQTGGFTSTDVLTQLKRLLASGVSPKDMLEILRRRELIERLPEYLHTEVVALLQDAVARDAAAAAAASGAAAQGEEVSIDLDKVDPVGGKANPPERSAGRPTGASGSSMASAARAVAEFVRPSPVDSSSLAAELAAARSALESEQSKTRKIEKSLAASMATAEAARARGEQALRESERYQNESRTLRDALAAGNAKSAQVQRTLGERDAQLAQALRSLGERGALVGEHDARLAQALRTLGERDARLAQALHSLSERDALVGEHDARLAQALRTLDERDAQLAQALRSLGERGAQVGERDTQFATLQQEHAKLLLALETRTKTGVQLEADLQEALARATALAADLTDARSALESGQHKSREIDETLAESAASAEAARARGEEALRESQRRETEARALRDSLAARDAKIVHVQQSLAERDAQLVHARQSLIERDAQLVHAQQSLVERDAQLAELQQEYAKRASALEARAKTGTQLEADLQAARAHAEAMTSELKASRDAVAALSAQLERSETLRQSARAELDALKSQSSSYLESLRTREWRRGFDHNLFRESDSRADASAKGRDALQTERDHLQAQLAVLQTELAARAALIDELRAAAAATTAANAERATKLQTAAERPEPPQPAKAGADTERAAKFPAVAERRESLQAAKAGADTERAAKFLAAAERRESLRTAKAGADAERAAALQTTAGLRESPPAAKARGQETLLSKKASFAPKLSPPKGVRVRKPATITVAIGWGAAVCVLAVVAWFFAHRAPAPVPAPVLASAAGPKPGAVIHDCPTCPAMTVLPAGRFKQGTARADGASLSSETPQHWVAIGRPLALSTNAVTVDEFQEFIAATGRDMQGCNTYDGEWKHRPKNSWKNPGFAQTGTHPVTCVSWNDAKAYAGWLSKKTLHRYRLPSASEWEYAARGGGEAVQPWNPDGSDACANANVADASAARQYPGWAAFACDDGYVYTAPAGSFKPNSFGLNDMLGNVFQWTEDCWHQDYTGAPVDGSARTDGNCTEHELRGGSWFSTPAYVRANYRNHFAADYRTSSVGIRLAREIEQ